MATCAVCGQRILFGGRRFLRKMARIEKLIAELQRAQREAQDQLPEDPPEVRSALLEVKPLLDPLVIEGGGLAADLHDAAHHRGIVVDANRLSEWESTAERVLFELLAALETSTQADRAPEDG